jgi:hypothetical protein
MSACLLVQPTYFCAKLGQASTLSANPESQEHDDRLCNGFLRKSQQYSGSLCEPCTGKAYRVLQILRNAV